MNNCYSIVLLYIGFPSIDGSLYHKSTNADDDGLGSGVENLYSSSAPIFFVRFVQEESDFALIPQSNKPININEKIDISRKKCPLLANKEHTYIESECITRNTVAPSLDQVLSTTIVPILSKSYFELLSICLPSLVRANMKTKIVAAMLPTIPIKKSLNRITSVRQERYAVNSTVYVNLHLNALMSLINSSIIINFNLKYKEI